MYDEFQPVIANIQSEFYRLTHNRCIFYPYTCEKDFKLEVDEEHWFCGKVISNDECRKLCERKRMQLLKGALRTREAIFSECHAGIGEFVVPCIYHRQLIGMFVVYTIPAVEYVPNMRGMANYYYSNFGISSAELEAYLNSLPKIHRFSMRPAMLLLQSLVRLNIESGLLPNINLSEHPGFEIGAFNEDPPYESRTLSYLNIMLEGERGGNAYQLLESNAQQLIHGVYSLLITRRSMDAKAQYDRLFEPSLRDHDLEVVKFNVITTFSKLFVFLMQKIPQFWDFYRGSTPIPRQIIHSGSLLDIREILEFYFWDIVAVHLHFNQSNPIVKKLTEYIDENYAQKATLSAAAANLHISTSYASRIFKEQMGVNFKWYLNEVRMNAAYNYLKRTKLPINSIASRVGYTEIRSFYKMFKAHFGVTCTKIRSLYSSPHTETDAPPTE